MTASLPHDWFVQIFGSGNPPTNAPLVYTGAQDLAVLLAFSKTFHPQTVVEVGIQRGITAQVLLNQGPWISSYIGIDITPQALPSLAIQDAEVPAKAGELVDGDPRVTVRVSLRGSRDCSPGDLPPVDLIFIDGDHSEEGVLYDTLLAREVIRPGGVICWHDYGNASVPSVMDVIDQLNAAEGNHIWHVEGTVVCFEIRRRPV